MVAQEVNRLGYFSGGRRQTSAATAYFDVWNPSTGEVIAQVPDCPSEEVELAVESARKAFRPWADTPPIKRVQVLYRFRELLEKYLDPLTRMVATEHGKVWEEAQGDVLKAKEVVEVACGIPSMLLGESMMNAATGYDTVLYREPLGVFVGISPFNFPAMIPMGWMMPLCIATGNTLVLRPSPVTPLTSMRMVELLYEAGLPEGVVNLVTCGPEQAERLIAHPAVKGVMFVGSTRVGQQVYENAARNGKRVQALCQAKNHALVMEDAPIERSARGIINGAFGCAGERCMALPVVAVHESIADELVACLVKLAKSRKVGPSYEKVSELGPLVTAQHRKSVSDWIQRGVEEGANLVLDGRGVVVDGYEQGFYLGPCIFDHVKPGMSIGEQEIFGPVLCVKRVKSFDEGVELINANPYANGSVIFTQNGYYSREFARRADAGMVGINVGIPVPVSVFPFSGHKQSFFGDLHTMGKDGIRFFTQVKSVTSTWFNEEEMKREKVDTWDGML
jgi:malonate-semialdehyde dehydrogenase (acetylating) / methylmalonate-semialdehyde dehydrogenase